MDLLRDRVPPPQVWEHVLQTDQSETSHSIVTAEVTAEQEKCNQLSSSSPCWINPRVVLLRAF